MMTLSQWKRGLGPRVTMDGLGACSCRGLGVFGGAWTPGSEPETSQVLDDQGNWVGAAADRQEPSWLDYVTATLKPLAANAPGVFKTYSELEQLKAQANAPPSMGANRPLVARASGGAVGPIVFVVGIAVGAYILLTRRKTR